MPQAVRNGGITADIILNLNGRICAEGLLVFGIGGLAIVYAIAPMIDDLVNRFNEKKVMVICTVLMVFFLADAVYSQIHPNTGKGVTDIEEARKRIPRSKYPINRYRYKVAVITIIKTGMTGMVIPFVLSLHPETGNNPAGGVTV